MVAARSRRSSGRTQAADQSLTSKSGEQSVVSNRNSQQHGTLTGWGPGSPQQAGSVHMTTENTTPLQKNTHFNYRGLTSLGLTCKYSHIRINFALMLPKFKGWGGALSSGSVRAVSSST